MKLNLSKHSKIQKKLTLLCAIAYQILLKSSYVLVISTRTSFWVFQVHDVVLVSNLVYFFTLHKSTKGPLPWFIQKNLKITNSVDVQFISTFFFKSQHNTEKNQNKYLTLQLKAVNWHYSWKLLSFWIFSGKRKYIWKYHFLQLKAVIILKIFLSKQVIWKHYFLQLVVVE